MGIKQKIPDNIKNRVKRSPLFVPVLNVMFNHKVVNTYTEIPTMLSHKEREYLFRLARDTHGTITELGCYAGGSTYFLAKGALRSGSHVYSVDPFSSFPERQLRESDGSDYSDKPSLGEVQRTMRKYRLEGTVTLIEGFSRDVADHWDAGPINLLWIDGNHSEVSGDFYAWKSHLAKDAVIALHDTNYPVLGRKDATYGLKRIIEDGDVKVLDRRDSITVIGLGP